MITEQELKNKCTPKFIKWMCEFAEGFSNYEYNHSLNRAIFDSIYYDVLDIRIFPLLIYRAVEGWNKKSIRQHIDIFIEIGIVSLKITSHENKDRFLYYLDYQPENLTQSECAELDCLLDIFKEEVSNGNNDTK